VLRDNRGIDTETMVLIIDGFEVEGTLGVSQLFERFQLLKANSLSVLGRPPRKVDASEACVYVGQKEAAVVAPGDSMRILGSEDATTCHIVILRDSHTGVTGIAHLDNDEPGDFRLLEREVRDRKGVKVATRELEDMEYDVSILGGYSDEEEISQDITEMLLVVMQGLKARFSLRLACIGTVNTKTKDGVAWPKIYGGGVEVDTGEVFTAQFSYHGPDPDIRALRLHSRGACLANIYDPYSGKIVVKPFCYQPMTDAHLWLQRTDEFILKYCSTSPKVEPPSFCDNMRANFRRMVSDPQPMVTLFGGNRAREYSRDQITGRWVLDSRGEKPEESDGISKHNLEWGVKDFRMSFN